MRRSIQILLIFLAVFFGTILNHSLSYSGKISPNISIAGVDVSGLTLKDAGNLIAEKISSPENIKLTAQNQSFDLATSDIGLEYDFSESAQRAFNMTRTGNFFYDYWQRILLFTKPKDIGLSTKLNEEELAKIISVIAGQISVDPVPPLAKFSDGGLTVNKGRAGTEVDSSLLRANIGRALAFAQSADIQIPVREVGSALTDSEAGDFRTRAEKYSGKRMEARFEFNSFPFSDNEILRFLNPRSDFDDGAVTEAAFKIAKEINRLPQNPKFAFDSGRVSEFLPARDGVELDNEKFKEELINSVISLAESDNKSSSFEISVKRTPPELTTDKVNDLGIKELIGRGTSRFRGSIPSRVHNIQLASAKLNGVLIKPGDTFSFNDALGDVSKFTGYQEAYVIREGKTVLGDGGGVCQVSTTFFRAALNSGLPILERQAHAYRVGYYEQDTSPGLDATVYGPTPDLRIKNDTPAHILIQAKVNTKTSSLVFEFYGTGDGRTATTSKPVVANVVLAGEDVYIDDPTLPAGTVKQTEHRANGAKVTFNYLVQRGGETIYKKTFTSNYRPWQAVYLRGTGQ